MGNFTFLQTYWPDFAKTMEFAEHYAYSDPASSKNKSGLFVELMIREMMRIEHIPEPIDVKENNHFNRTRILKNEGLIPYDVNQWINQVRIKRNTAAHENDATEQDALLVLRFAHHIAVWFMQTYGDSLFAAQPFINQPIGIVEAKPYAKNVYAIIDNQCREYAQHITVEDEKCCLGMWYGYKVPFIFATNGRPYLKQIETESGIWFQDLRNKTNTPIALHGWYSPEDLLAKFRQNIDEADRALENLPYDFLRDPDGLNLRHYQLSAVEAVEHAVVNGQRQILLAMATGTGKTRTVLGMVYRFLKTGRFRRILFLVDRTALGEQAQDVFNDVKLEDLQPLNKIYAINTLNDIDLATETRVQVATVQGMISRIMSEEKDRIPSSGDFDCIIIDEAHRGYTLDRELSDAELLYRDQNDFISKYKKVIEYFDAVRIGLTATPALHTTQIFGNAVFTYSYREAVIDGYLVDYDAPYSIKTELNQHGIHHQKGERLARYNPVTKELLNPEELEDELNFDVEDFNKKVITSSFNEAVLTELAQHIDPEGEEKTLIFAVSDRHADEIVKQLRDIYAPQGITASAIEKITYAIGDKGRVQNAIKRFKNEHYPTIAVTVDLLSTGIDVPEITKIVFMRRIKSRILYEQMLGRATRLCPQINKTHFEIYDAVDLYSYLNGVSSMKPTVSNPSVTFDELLEGYKAVTDSEHIAYINDQIIAKLQRAKFRMDQKQLNFFTVTSNYGSIEHFITDVKERRKHSEEVCRDLFLEKRRAFNAFKEQRSTGYYLPISDKPDEVHEVTRGYGKGQEPKDYLESFSQYIKTNRDKIEALEIICTRPADLTLAGLRSVSMTLDANGFNRTRLNTAITQLTKEECAADIITLIRSYAIGSPLVSHEERIRNAVKKLCKAHNFTASENSSNIDEPKNLEKIIKSIDELDWYSAKEEGLGNLYEGLLEKNANEKKSGAGQYFTPRVLIDMMTRLTAPQVGERCNAPACGTFGFMISADRYVKSLTDDYCDLNEKDAAFQVKEAFTGDELVHETHRLALMNAMLHNIEGKIVYGDTLSESGKAMTGYDVVLTNPPFGTKKGGERATRDDFTYTTSNKQLNFLQHIYRSLKTTGTARAAVVLPDNVLFEDNTGQKIRRDLMNKCNLHTILRLPTGIFYANGVKANVLFFEKGSPTQETWYYDYRTGIKHTLATKPLKRSDLEDFVKCYCAGRLKDRKETWSPENPNGRWRKYHVNELLARDKTGLDISWIKDGSDTVNCSLAELMQTIQEKSTNIAAAVTELSKLIEGIEE